MIRDKESKIQFMDMSSGQQLQDTSFKIEASYCYSSNSDNNDISNSSNSSNSRSMTVIILWIF